MNLIDIISGNEVTINQGKLTRDPQLSWDLEQRIVPQGINSRRNTENFGRILASTDNRLVVGTPEHPYNMFGADALVDSGSVWVYKRRELTGSNQPSIQQKRRVFTYTGSDQTFIVPNGTTMIRAKVWGAAGASSRTCLGGIGGYSESILNVGSGQTLTIIVGEGGKQGAGPGAYGGGGAKDGSHAWNPGRGGGRSAVQVNGVEVITAGGGGGAGIGQGRNNQGGAGGGITGGNALDTTVTPNIIVLGGNKEGVVPNGATPGADFTGGDAVVYDDYGNGSGGGGYQGGTSGSDIGGGSGAGGSGYLSPDLTGYTELSNNVYPPKLEDPDFIAGVSTVQIDTDGGDGLIILEWNEASGQVQLDTWAWDQEARITPQGGNLRNIGDKFGSSIAIQDDQMYIGAPFHQWNEALNAELYGAGAVFIYRYENNLWQQGLRILSNHRSYNANFGASIAITDDLVIIGSPNHSSFPNNINNSGIIEVFTRTGAYLRTITSPIRIENENYGYNLHFSEGKLFVGCPGTRKVYVYNVDGQTITLNFTINGLNEGTGKSISFKDGLLALGAPDSGGVETWEFYENSWNFLSNSVDNVGSTDRLRFLADFDNNVNDQISGVILGRPINKLLITKNTTINNTIPTPDGNNSLDISITGGYAVLENHGNNEFNLDGDFTIEWMEYHYSYNLETGSAIVAFGGSNDVNLTSGTDSSIYKTQGGFITGMGTGNNLFYASSGEGWDIANARPMGYVTLNTWHTVSIQRRGEQWSIFRDGKMVSIWTPATTGLRFNITNLGVMFNGWIKKSWKGRIANFHVMRGIAKYPTTTIPNVTIPMLTGSSDPMWDKTALLMRMDGSSNQQNFTEERYGIGVTARGNARFSSTRVFNGTTSAFFDGNGDALVIDANSGLYDVANGDFTIEFSFNFENRGTGQKIFVTHPSSWSIFLAADNSLGCNMITTSGTFSIVTAAQSISNNRWYKLVVQRQNNLVIMYLDGTRVGQIALTIPITETGSQIVIGSNGTVTTSFFNGYIDDFRFTKAVRYNNIELPSLPIQSISQSTSLLSMDNNIDIVGSKNSSTTTVTNNGMSINTSRAAIGRGSLSHNGTTLSYNTRGRLNTYYSNFTMEVYVSSLIDTYREGSNNISDYFNPPNKVPNQSYYLYYDREFNIINLPGYWRLYLQRTTSNNDYSPGNLFMEVFYEQTSYTINLGTTTHANWNHVSLVRQGNRLTAFFNGVVKNVFMLPDNYCFPGAKGNLVLGSSYYYGWTDQLSVTIDQARYTSTFTPSYTRLLGSDNKSTRRGINVEVINSSQIMVGKPLANSSLNHVQIPNNINYRDFIMPNQGILEGGLVESYEPQSRIVLTELSMPGLESGRYAGDQFGYLVKADEGNIMIGAPNHPRDARNSKNSVGSGAIYHMIWDGNNVKLNGKITYSNRNPVNYFYGKSFDYKNKSLLVACPDYFESSYGYRAFSYTTYRPGDMMQGFSNLTISKWTYRDQMSEVWTYDDFANKWKTSRTSAKIERTVGGEEWNSGFSYNQINKPGYRAPKPYSFYDYFNELGKKGPPLRIGKNVSIVNNILQLSYPLGVAAASGYPNVEGGYLWYQTLKDYNAGRSRKKAVNPGYELIKAPGELLGTTVGMSGEQIVVGAPGYAGNKGAVLLFDYNEGERIYYRGQILQPDDLETGMRWGTRLTASEYFITASSIIDSGYSAVYRKTNIQTSPRWSISREDTGSGDDRWGIGLAMHPDSGLFGGQPGKDINPLGDSGQALTVRRHSKPIVEIGDFEYSEDAIFGSSAIFNGSNYLQVNTSNSWNVGTGGFTIETWIKTSSPFGTIWSSDYNSTNNNGRMWFGFGRGSSVEDAGKLSFHAGGNMLIMAQSPLVNDGEWHNVAVSRNGNIFRLFIDGIKVAEENTTANITFTSGILIGTTRENIPVVFTGLMDSLRFFTTGLYTTDFTPALQKGNINSTHSWDNMHLALDFNGNTNDRSHAWWSDGVANSNRFIPPGYMNGRFADDQFGKSVLIDTDYLAVGIPGHSFNVNGQSIADAQGAIQTFNLLGEYQGIKLIDSTGVAGQRFGEKIELRNEYMLVTGSTDIPVGVILNTDNSFQQIGRITGDMGTLSTSSMTILSDTGIAFGQPGFDHNSSNTDTGNVKIFDGLNWGDITRLVAPASTGNRFKNLRSDQNVAYMRGRNVNDLFGSSVDVLNNIITVGVPNHRYNLTAADQGGSPGAIMTFWKDGQDWVYGTKIFNTGSATGGNFRMGTSLRMNNDKLAIVGLSNSSNRGIMQLLQKSGTGYDTIWTNIFEQIGDNQTSPRMGSSVAFDVSDKIILGAPTQDTDIVDSGVFYNVINDSVWRLEDRYKVPGPVNGRIAGDLFGTAVAIKNDRIVVSAPGQSYNSVGENFVSAVGAFYEYRNSITSNQFIYKQKFVPTQTAGLSMGKWMEWKGNILVTGNQLLESANGIITTFQDNGSWTEKRMNNSIQASEGYGNLATIMSDTDVIVARPYHSGGTTTPGYQAILGSGAVSRVSLSTNWNTNELIVIPRIFNGQVGDVGTTNSRMDGNRLGTKVGIGNNFIIATSPGKHTTFDGVEIGAVRGGFSDWNISGQNISYGSFYYPSVGENNGTNLKIYGNNVAIGTNSRVTVFSKDATWKQDFSSTNALYGENFDFAFIDNEFLVVGRPLGDGNPPINESGELVIFAKNPDWVNTSYILQIPGFANGRKAGDHLGTSVAIGNNFALIGAVDHSYTLEGASLPASCGAVFQYNVQGSDWQFSNKLLDVTPLNNGKFGSKIALDVADTMVTTNHYAAISNGASYYGLETNSAFGGPLGRGSVTVFNRATATSWRDMGYIARNDDKDIFGAVTMADGNLAIGLPLMDRVNSSSPNTVVNSGGFSTHTYRGGVLPVDIQISPGISFGRFAGDQMGSSVIMGTDWFAVGMKGHDYSENGTEYSANRGAVDIFRKNLDNTWSYDRKLWVPSNLGGTNFGSYMTSTPTGLQVGGLDSVWLTDRNVNGQWTSVNYIPNVTVNKSIVIGNILLVGDPMNSTAEGRPNVSEAGKVLAYQKDGNQYLPVTALDITAPGKSNGRTAGDFFGKKVFLGSGFLASTAPGHRYTNDGFQRSGTGSVWIHNTVQNNKFETKILPEMANENFATGLVGNETRIMIGGQTGDQTKHLIYNRVTDKVWQQEIASVAAYSTTGRSNAMALTDGYRAFVGQPIHVGPAGGVEINAGSVSNLNGMDWTNEKTIIQPGVSNSRKSGDEWGASIAVNKFFVLVGSPKHTFTSQGSPNIGSGAVWIFNRQTTGLNFLSIHTEDNVGINGFGSSIAISPNNAWVAVGCKSSNQVLMYRFNGQDLTLVANLMTVIPGNYEFGTSLSLTNNKLIVGAPGYPYLEDGTGELANAGAAFEYKLIGNNWEYSKQFVEFSWDRRYDPTVDPDLPNVIENLGRQMGDRFGFAVAQSKQGIIISGPGHDFDQTNSNPINDAGAAWVMENN